MKQEKLSEVPPRGCPARKQAAEVRFEWGCLDYMGAVASICMGCGRNREVEGSSCSPGEHPGGKAGREDTVRASRSVCRECYVFMRFRGGGMLGTLGEAAQNRGPSGDKPQREEGP